MTEKMTPWGVTGDKWWGLYGEGKGNIWAARQQRPYRERRQRGKDAWGKDEL